jgi:AraC family transcriptional regulator of adaptative response/methylated-DNA-[protein]-cysteine methyltransferase
VRFAVGATSLGPVLVARGAGGVRAVLFGADRDELDRDLAARLPGAVLVEDGAALAGLVARVAALVDAPGRGPALGAPLDPGGTAFQRRVWQALCEIPAGRTASYTDVAARVGAPRAVRAVARACAANPLAVVVPCHRVVARDGRPGGYRWGAERKRALLEREAAAR